VTDEHEWVRRLLADAGSDAEPMPAHVADRLDAALAALVTEEAPDEHDVGRALQPEAAAVRLVPMTRRGHRRWGAGLLAAAAITVGGYGIAATGVLDGVTGDGAETTSAGSAADTRAREQAPAADRPGGALRDSLDAQKVRIPALSSQTLRRDAAQLARTSRVAAPGDRRATPELTACITPPPAVRGTRISVSLDGDPATAILRQRQGDRAVVEVWSCEAPSRLARVVVPGGR
jgi:hypothetical protein